MTRNYAEEDSVKKGLASLAVALGASEGDVAQIDSSGNLTLAPAGGGSGSSAAFMWSIETNTDAIADSTVIDFVSKVFGSPGTDLVAGVFTVDADHVGVWTFSASIALFGGDPTESALGLQVIPVIGFNITPAQLAPYDPDLGADLMASYAYNMAIGDQARVAVNHNATLGNHPTLAGGSNVFFAGVYHGPLAT